MTTQNQQSLFNQTDFTGPMANSNRPTKIEELLSQREFLNKHPYLLKNKPTQSLVFYGPPGCGKSTIISLLANTHFPTKKIKEFNAVMDGVKELKSLIESNVDFFPIVLIVDEIHRLNKVAQDALLPYLEKGQILLLGSTTENPRSALTKPILSRIMHFELKYPTPASITKILQFNASKKNLEVPEHLLTILASFCHGDLRLALNSLEKILLNYSVNELNEAIVKEVILTNSREYDLDSDRHYDVISAFIKSLRGSDPDAALLWLSVMIDGGEDPLFIARRLIIFASEDVGNADPTALTLAISAFQAVQLVGFPEARISLGQITTYLASTVKSNASYNGINEALEFVKSNSTLEVPDHLKNFPKHDVKYKYPHAYPNNFVHQKYSVNPLPKFYRPTDNGVEKRLSERLKGLWN